MTIINRHFLSRYGFHSIHVDTAFRTPSICYYYYFRSSYPSTYKTCCVWPLVKPRKPSYLLLFSNDDRLCHIDHITRVINARVHLTPVMHVTLFTIICRALFLSPLTGSSIALLAIWPNPDSSISVRRFSPGFLRVSSYYIHGRTYAHNCRCSESVPIQLSCLTGSSIGCFVLLHPSSTILVNFVHLHTWHGNQLS